MEVIDLLTIIGRIPPQVWDAVEPHAPSFGPDLASLVALNPQPLPPEPPPEQFLIEAGHMAKHIVRLAVDDAVRGGEPQQWISDLVRD